MAIRGETQVASQLRRAVSSVPANLAEGVGRGTPGERVRFAQIARRSAYETATFLYLAERRQIGDVARIRRTQSDLLTLIHGLHRFIAWASSERAIASRPGTPSPITETATA
ncbi:MAG: four helix bundle protein [Methanobacteriota archaeon]